MMRKSSGYDIARVKITKPLTDGAHTGSVLLAPTAMLRIVEKEDGAEILQVALSGYDYHNEKSVILWEDVPRIKEKDITDD